MTNEQVQQNVRAAQARIKSGKLKQNAANAWLIVTNVTSKGLEPTVDNLYAAIVESARALEWDVRPNFLKLQDQNERPAVITPVHKSDAQRAAIEKAAEAKAAKEKKDANFEKETTSLIANYQEINRAGRIAYGAQESHKKRLHDWVTASKGRVSAEAIFRAVQNEINRLYAASEKERERV